MTERRRRALRVWARFGTALGLAGCAGPAADRMVELDLAAPATREQLWFTDAAAWRTSADAGPGVTALELFGASRYTPPHRSPLNVALLRERVVGDFDLQLRARQTGREYPHRDLVIVCAWRDAAHFVYAHLASAADDNAHHVMLVDGADRRPITTWRTSGVAWGDGWHDLRLLRRGRALEVSFDGSPVLRAEVPDWRGNVGFGSFDDTGAFASLRLRIDD
jgi:hypothetical protein